MGNTEQDFIYCDNFKFTKHTVDSINNTLKEHGIVYAQIFGSYLTEKDTGCYNDIDILVIGKDNGIRDILTEEIDYKLTNILGSAVHTTPLFWCDNLMKSCIVSSETIIYYDDSYDSLISTEIEHILRWNDTSRAKVLELIDISL